MRVETAERGKRASGANSAQKLESLQFMASYYSAQCELTHWPLYDLCLKITVKAMEKELDGGSVVGTPICHASFGQTPQGVLAKASDRSGLAECQRPRSGYQDPPAVQPSTASILLRMLDDGKSRPIDGLIFASGKSVPEVLGELLKLELSGKVRKLPGSRYVRK